MQLPLQGCQRRVARKQWLAVVLLYLEGRRGQLFSAAPRGKWDQREREWLEKADLYPAGGGTV